LSRSRGDGTGIGQNGLKKEKNVRICYFNDWRLGVVEGDAVVDVTDFAKGEPNRDSRDLICGVIERWDHYKSKFEEAAVEGKGVPLTDVRLRPPVPRPGSIVCMAVNYMEDGTLAEKPPIGAFHKGPTAIIGESDTMVLPDTPATIFEGEAEVAIVIGKRATRVSEADALAHVFGYTCFIDGSARGLLPSNNIFFPGKSRDTFAPIGPWIVTADEIANPNKLAITLTNNGQVMQSFNTSDMAHHIPRCIEWVSSIQTLEPGDIVATGTNHRGLNPFMDGDKIALTVEKVGTLNITVVDPLKRSWARVTRLKHKESGGEGAHTAQLTGKYAQI
jgi:2-keto-4-pentenoate hydratase/2-oxohepta-3-ene-1,7-dioic acid hydratase in catechol pathway